MYHRQPALKLPNPETKILMSVVANRLIALIAERYHVEAETITRESTLEELGINSLGAISMICELEEEFGVGMLSDDVLGIRTVGQAVASLERASLEDAARTPSQR